MLSVKKHVQQLGFTLIELMVVVAIIGLLLAAGLASYTSVQKTARDGRRIQDVKTIQDALEQYRGVNNAYPILTTAGALPSLGTGTWFASGAAPTTPTGGPAGTAGYTYLSDAAGTAYCMCTGVENGLKGNATTQTVGSCGGVTPSATTVLYCLGSQQ